VSAAILLGPDRLPDYARQAGHIIRKLRQIANSTRDDLLGELGRQLGAFELDDLDPRALIRQHILESDDAALSAALEN
jgi:sec-independent protein translocase protein TatB